MKNKLTLGALYFVALFALVAFTAIVTESTRVYISHSLAVVKKGDRFVVLYKQDNDDTTFEVIQDVETGKKYLFYNYYQTGGLVEIR